jgi:small-conductance mechanosensitive channel
MVKKNKAHAVKQLVKQGYSNKEILGRIAVSGGYISQIRKKLAEEKAARAAEKLAEEKAIQPEVLELTEDMEEVLHKASQGKDKPKPGEFVEVDTVLDTRADQYGSFMQSADAAIRLKGIMHNAIARNDAHLFPDQILALDMIAVKLSRIVNGNASHRDSWLDIAGYAKLVADRLGGISR